MAFVPNFEFVQRPVFISFEHAEAFAETSLLWSALASKSVQSFYRNGSVGDDLESQNEAACALVRCKLVVIIGSSQYGTRTESLVSSYYEMISVAEWARKGSKGLIIAKLCEEFQLQSTREQLSGFETVSWPKGQPVPEKLVQLVLHRLMGIFLSQQKVIHLNTRQQET